jgi:hypothetical protein
LPSFFKLRGISRSHRKRKEELCPHGDQHFEPWPLDPGNPRSEWLVRCPWAAARHFCRIGGFAPLIDRGDDRG